MKTFVLILSLFVAQMSFANAADLVCRTKHFGYDQRQITVYLTHKPTHAEAVVAVTSTSALYQPLFFRHLAVYGINGAVTYVNRDPGMNLQPRFGMTLRSAGRGTLELGNAVYSVSCVSARDPIVAM